MQPTETIWMNGEWVPWDEAKVHVLTHALHYGSGVFEGVRAYETAEGAAVFRLDDHLERMRRSASIYSMEVPYDLAALREATLETIRRNDLAACYVRPIAYRGYGQLGINPLNCPVDVAIATWEWGAYLGEEGLTSGVRAHMSSYRRVSGVALPGEAKATGGYLNSILAKLEATAAGFDEAILADEHGSPCEGTGENLFVVRHGEVITPPLDTNILPGITRSSVVTLLADRGIDVVQRRLTRADVLLADELFLTGTAAEVTPVREVDGHRIPAPGEVTRIAQEAFFAVVRGQDDRYRDWLTPVRAAAPAP